MKIKSPSVILGGLALSAVLWTAGPSLCGPGGTNNIGTMPNLGAGPGVVTPLPRPDQALFVRGTWENLLGAVTAVAGQPQILCTALDLETGVAVVEFRGNCEVKLLNAFVNCGAVQVGLLSPTDFEMAAAFTYGSSALPPVVVPPDSPLDILVSSWVSFNVPLPPYQVHTVAPVAGRASYSVLITPNFTTVNQVLD